MSTDRGEPEPQEWQTYPGIPSDADQPSAQPHRATPQPGDQRPRPYAEPDPTADSAYQAYRDYAHSQPDLRHEQLQPYQQAPYQQPRNKNAAWLQDKWMWIVGGIVAVFVITALAQGNFPWMAIIFGVIVWNILRHKRGHR